jgi:hypothetical protein
VTPFIEEKKVNLELGSNSLTSYPQDVQLLFISSSLQVGNSNLKVSFPKRIKGGHLKDDFDLITVEVLLPWIKTLLAMLKSLFNLPIVSLDHVVI